MNQNIEELILKRAVEKGMIRPEHVRAVEEELSRNLRAAASAAHS